MLKSQSNKIAISISIFLHIVIFGISIFIGANTNNKNEDKVVEITIGGGPVEGFGLGMAGTPEGKGKENITTKDEFDKKASDSKEVTKDEKKINIASAKSTDETNTVTNKTDKNSDNNANNIPAKLGDTEERAKGNGGSGYDIQWGGKGKRKIYRYYVPAYPDGVQLEANVKLRFTILPDGSVTRITPLVKTHPQLESVATNALTRWRFEPLEGEEFEQTVTIIFPFRLR